MDHTEIAVIVTAIVAECTGQPLDKVQPDSDIVALGADSLDILDMAAEGQTRFGIEISDDDLSAIKTPRLFAEAVERALATKTAS